MLLQLQGLLSKEMKTIWHQILLAILPLHWFLKGSLAIAHHKQIRLSDPSLNFCIKEKYKQYA